MTSAFPRPRPGAGLFNNSICCCRLPATILLFLHFHLPRRQFFLRHRGFGRAALQFLGEGLDVGLGGGVLLFEFRPLLLQLLEHLLEFLGLAGGLCFPLPRRFAGLVQFRLQLVRGCSVPPSTPVS